MNLKALLILNSPAWSFLSKCIFIIILTRGLLEKRKDDPKYSIFQGQGLNFLFLEIQSIKFEALLRLGSIRSIGSKRSKTDESYDF